MQRSTHCALAFLALVLASLATAQAQPAPRPWVDVEENGGIVYFAFASPPRIERYDLTARRWLSDVALNAVPTAIAVDQQRLYVSFGARTSRLGLNGAGEVLLIKTSVGVQDLYVLGSHLVLAQAEHRWSIDKLSGKEIDHRSSFYDPIVHGDVAPSRRKVFSPSFQSNLRSQTLDPDGTFGEQRESPEYPQYPKGSRAFVFPGEGRVADDSGVVYNTSDLTFSHSLGGRLDDMAFHGDLPVVLRDGEVVAYDNLFQETGRHRPAHAPLEIEVRGDTVFSFHAAPGGLDVETFPVALLDPAEPGLPVDPAGLAYAPDEMLVGKDDVIYILSRTHLSVFRWSILQRRYLETLPLAEAPAYMAYSATTHRLYFAYPDGPIRQIRLSETTAEAPFADLPHPPCGLAAAGEYVFACGSSDGPERYTYHPAGTLISHAEVFPWPDSFVWSEALRRMYFFSVRVSPSDLYWEEIRPDGTLGEEHESPYHAEIRREPPIRVAPDGSTLVIGSGHLFDPLTLVRTGALPNAIGDAAWLQGALFTLRSVDGEAELQKWGPGQAVAAQRRIPGEALRLFARSSNLLAVTSVDGVPRFTLVDGALNDVAPLPPLNLADGRFSVRTVWRTPDGAADEGHAVQLTRDTGYFWFFNSANVEMVLKILDGCGINGRFWVFAGGLTNVEVEILVVDNLTGEIRTYLNPQGTAFLPILDTDALAGCGSSPAADLRAVSSGASSGVAASDLLLNKGRFRVEITWETPNGDSGAGVPVQLTSDTGYFWFFDDDNVETVIKVLDGCAVNGRYWVFAGGLTNVRTEIRVTDTLTDARRTYTNPQGQPFLPLQDTEAFAHCP